MKVKVLSLAAVVFALIAGLGGGVAEAQPNWCQICDDTGGCWECCRCAGGTQLTCIHACGGFAAGKLAATEIAAISSQPALCPASGFDQASPVSEAQPALQAIAEPEAAPTSAS